MSVSGISSSTLYDTQSVQSTAQQLRQEFQQLGQDLQSSNLSAAQSDFATLQNLSAQNSPSTSQTSNPITQAFSQLAKDLQSGNLSGAQQDFATIQQDFKNQSTQGQTGATQGHHHHHQGRRRSKRGQPALRPTRHRPAVRRPLFRATGFPRNRPTAHWPSNSSNRRQALQCRHSRRQRPIRTEFRSPPNSVPSMETPSPRRLPHFSYLLREVGGVGPSDLMTEVWFWEGHDFSRGAGPQFQRSVISGSPGWV